jgi:dihydroneopterin aldolase
MSLKPATAHAEGVAALWDPAQSYMRVILRDAVTEVPLGLHPWERHPERPTRVVVNVEMFVKLPNGLGAEGREGIVDYDRIRERLKQWPSRPHTPLLETLVAELVDLCFEHKRVDACRVSVLKPDIFNDAAAAGVEAYIRRADHEGARP